MCKISKRQTLGKSHYCPLCYDRFRPIAQTGSSITTNGSDMFTYSERGIFWRKQLEDNCSSFRDIEFRRKSLTTYCGAT